MWDYYRPSKASLIKLDLGPSWSCQHKWLGRAVLSARADRNERNTASSKRASNSGGEWNSLCKESTWVVTSQVQMGTTFLFQSWSYWNRTRLGWLCFTFYPALKCCNLPMTQPAEFTERMALWRPFVQVQGLDKNTPRGGLPQVWVKHELARTVYPWLLRSSSEVCSAFLAHPGHAQPWQQWQCPATQPWQGPGR